MRTEEQMMKLLLDTAQEDDRIRAVYMNGSRTNPSAPKDIFQDYDIVYVVEDITPFVKDRTWIDRFGLRLFMQEPERLDAVLAGEEPGPYSYGWLIQLADGNRLDLHVITMQVALGMVAGMESEAVTADTLTIVLLDKDAALPQLPEASDRSHWIPQPSAGEFECCTNEFWWLQDNVAKGLWREELTYVMDMCNRWIRPELLKMLSWHAGMRHDFRIGAGKSGKYLKGYLPDGWWERYMKTFAAADVTAMWNAAECACSLFDEAARSVAKQMGFRYNETEADESFAYLKHVRGLSKDAVQIYE